jgi:very-short-patch-repair endonuclease
MIVIKCKICFRKYCGYVGLAAHIRPMHNITSQQYYDEQLKKNKNKGKCLNCKKQTKFKDLHLGYNKFCGHFCKSQGKFHPCLGKTHSKETRQKMSDAHKGERKIVKCLNCYVEFDVIVRSKRKYCSHSCAASYRNKYECNPMWNKKSRLKNGKSQKKRLKNKENHPMYQKKHSESTKQIIREKRLDRVLPLKDTKIEVALQKTFKKEKIKFIKHVNILNLTQPDIFIEPNVCVYADGDYWHGPDFPERQKKDIQITSKLRHSGFSVFRFKEHKIKQNVDVCVNKVKNHLFYFKEFYLQSIVQAGEKYE